MSQNVRGGGRGGGVNDNNIESREYPKFCFMERSDCRITSSKTPNTILSLNVTV